MGIEEAIEKKIFGGHDEKTFIEKILAKGDSERVRELVSKDMMSRSELMELLNLMSGNEIKLLNYDDWDRYIMSKLFVWIRDFVAVIELVMDYEKDLETRKIALTRRGLYSMQNVQRNLQHTVKFLADLYFNLIRSSLSLNAAGFKETLTNKYEVSYPQMSSLGQQVEHGQGRFRAEGRN